jgi:hypothetical protein|nr:MAG: hypothetical protein [Bacteriophage sp.]
MLMNLYTYFFSALRREVPKGIGRVDRESLRSWPAMEGNHQPHAMTPPPCSLASNKSHLKTILVYTIISTVPEVK